MEERASRRVGGIEDEEVEMAEAGRFCPATMRFARSLRLLVVVIVDAAFFR